MKEAQQSLSEVHGSVHIPKRYGAIRRFIAFAGPAYLVSVGYMDPGNWATDIEGGARFGYQLLWVILMSNLMAVLLQTLAARLGIVAGKDLAQACRDEYPKPVSIALWILCEIAITACDLAEVLGTAIGLNLLFHIPLVIGVLITGFDTLLLLLLQNFGIRKIEFFIVLLVSVMGLCFGIELILSKPLLHEIVGGFVPRLTPESLYIAIGILGATVMPHNLYLHSALVQTRSIEQSPEGKAQACRFNLLDTSVALNAAFFINAAILIVSASAFWKNGIVVTEIQQAHQLLSPLLGATIASTLFALALLAAGQSSTLTGTYAGQIVMEGFLRLKLHPVVRRLLTRFLAITPAVIVLAIKGEDSAYDLLIFSQVVLSMQLPFAVIPLVKFTSDPALMGSFANKSVVKFFSFIISLVIVVLNIALVSNVLVKWYVSGGGGSWVFWGIIIPLVVAILFLLAYVSLPKRWRIRMMAKPEEKEELEPVSPHYDVIGVALDLGKHDVSVLSHARQLAQSHNARVVLMHVVEGVGGQIYGEEANDEEARKDFTHLENHANQLREAGLEVISALGYGKVPKEIVRICNEHKVKLLIMGAHGHRGISDIIFGTTVNKVRHALKIPVLVVQQPE
jgi:manganese transport protein